MSDIIRVESITQLHEFNGLDKPKHPLVTVWHQKKFHQPPYLDEFIGKRIVIDLYMISLKMGISGSLQYGRNSYDFQEGTMVYTAPGQVISIDEPYQSHDGWGLFFHPDLIRKSELGKKMDTYSFFSYEANEALHLSDDEKMRITNCVLDIEQEYMQNIDKHSQNLIISNIELLLNYSKRFYDRQFYTRTNFNKDIVTKFDNLLTGYYRAELQLESGVPTVKYCAEHLNLSPNYLSDLLKKETGCRAIDHIHAFIIEKAKTVLLNSENTVNEIAYDLGFEYPQYFGKLFKSKTGVSPAEYRNLN